jgi:hypothetical protein
VNYARARLGGGTISRAGTFGNTDEPAQGAINTQTRSQRFTFFVMNRPALRPADMIAS